MDWRGEKGMKRNNALWIGQVGSSEWEERKKSLKLVLTLHTREKAAGDVCLSLFGGGRLAPSRKSHWVGFHANFL